MEFDAFKDLQFMYDKLLHYGQTKWQNIVLPSWEKAYRRAFQHVYGNTQKTRFGFFVAILGGIIGAQTIGIQVFFAPIFFALSKWTGDEPQVPLKSTATPEDFVADKKIEFGMMLDACQSAIEELIGRIKGGDDIVTEPEFESFLANALLSPIWYPPRDHDVEYLAKRLERRMWAQAWMENRDDHGTASECWRGIDHIGHLPGDVDADIDYGKVNSLYNMLVMENIPGPYGDDLKRDYMEGRTEQARGWRAAMAPIILELARPAPLEYPLPGYVQAYVREVARLDSYNSALALVGSPVHFNSQIILNVLPAAPVSRRTWWRSLPQ